MDNGICIYASVCDYQGTVCKTRRKKARRERRNMKGLGGVRTAWRDRACPGQQEKEFQGSW